MVWKLVGALGRATAAIAVLVAVPDNAATTAKGVAQIRTKLFIAAAYLSTLEALALMISFRIPEATGSNTRRATVPLTRERYSRGFGGLLESALMATMRHSRVASRLRGVSALVTLAP